MKLLLDSADVVDLKSFHFVKKNRLTQFSQTLLLAVLIQPNSKETAGFRKFLEKTLSQSSSIKSLSMLLLGTDEVLANIVEHELQDSPRQNIEIRLYELSEKNKKLWLVYIVFEGDSSNMFLYKAKSPKRQLTKGADGGYGLYLIKRIFQNLGHHYSNRQNSIALVFNDNKKFS